MCWQLIVVAAIAGGIAGMVASWATFFALRWLIAR